jgi:hypothetical protein
MFLSYDNLQEENILLARITQLTTDPLVDMVAVMGDVCASLTFKDNGEWKLYTSSILTITEPVTILIRDVNYYPENNRSLVNRVISSKYISCLKMVV